MKIQRKIVNRRNALRKLTILLVAVVLVVDNATAIRTSDTLQWQEEGESLQDEFGTRQQLSDKNHRQLLLSESACLLYQKHVMYRRPGTSQIDESWVCQLSTKESEILDTEYFDLDESSSVFSSALENAISGETTLTMNGVYADADRMRLFVPEEARVEVRREEIILNRVNNPPAKQGTLKLLVIRVTDGNNLAPQASADKIYENIFEDEVCFKSQMKACSFGKLQIEPFTGISPSQQTINNGIVDINVTGIASNEGQFVREARKAAKEKLGNLDDPRFDLVMFCLPKGPKGMVAWAFTHSKFSFYTNKWCGAVGSTMHEVGHNLGLGHSGERRKGDTSDGVGFMGKIPGKRDVRLCYNAQKSYQLGWYDDRTETINPVDGKGFRNFTLNGIAEYERKNQAIVVLRLKQVDRIPDFYIGFNLATGINSDTGQDKGKVIIVRKDKGGHEEYGQSTKIASLIPGQRHVIRNFDNVRNVQIVFQGLENGSAKIVVVDNDDQLPNPAFRTGDEKCKKFTIELKTHKKPKDIAWYITDELGNVAANSQKYKGKRKKYIQEVCLPMHIGPKTYKFTILDDGGNDMCCRRGRGSYKIFDDQGQTIFKGAKFSASKHHAMQVPKDPRLSPSNEPTLAPTGLPTYSSNPSSSVAPSSSPTELCVDNPLFRYNGRMRKGCIWVAVRWTSRRCKKEGVTENCRATCDPRCKTSSPTMHPTSISSNIPSSGPSLNHSTDPSSFPSNQPSFEPSLAHSIHPTSSPSNVPSVETPFAHSADPSSMSSEVSSSVNDMSQSPSISPSSLPSFMPSSIPAVIFAESPSGGPSSMALGDPTGNLFESHSGLPSFVPSSGPAANLTESPIGSSYPSSLSGASSEGPSSGPIVTFSESPLGVPVSTASRGTPSAAPSLDSSDNPSESPLDFPSFMPLNGEVPSSRPIVTLSESPSDFPSVMHLSGSPSEVPSSRPIVTFSESPSGFPSVMPSSDSTSEIPSLNSSDNPSKSPSGNPSFSPSVAPSVSNIPSTSPPGESSSPSTTSLMPSGVLSSSPTDPNIAAAAALTSRKREYYVDSQSVTESEQTTIRQGRRQTD